MTDLNEQPRKQLQFIITKFGQSVCDDPLRCESSLRESCPDHKLEVNLLITALQEKIPQYLLSYSSLITLERLIKTLARRLENNHGTAEAFAVWAVESWALALNVMPIAIDIPKQKIGKFIVRGELALDTETNLIWCRFSYGQTWKDSTTSGNAKKVDLKTAFEIAQQFSSQGYADWRLPTTDELKTLLTDIAGKNGYYIDEVVFPGSPRRVWSSVKAGGGVSFKYRNIVKIDPKKDAAHVRLVRTKKVKQ
jgi:hypothetical protein